MAVTQKSDIVSTIEQIVSRQTTMTLIQESVALPCVRDISGEVSEGMDRLDVNLYTELPVQDVNEDGTAMVPSTIDPSAAMLELNRHKSVAFSVTSTASQQSKLNLVEDTIYNANRSLVAEVDDAIFAEAVANAKTTLTVAASDALAAILEAKQQFDLDKVPRADRCLVASPMFCALLLSTNNVIRANEFGSTQPIQNGFLSNIFNFTIVESPSASLPNDGFLAMHKEGMIFARQRAVEFESERKVLEQRTDFTLCHRYGVKSSAPTNARIFVYDPV
jgi:hypothetical protein